MSLFLIIFFTVYGLLHIYVFVKVRAALSPGLYPSLLLWVIMLAMILAPVIVHYLEHAGMDTPARIISYTGYIWMGLLFLFVSAAVIIDIFRIIVFCLRISGITCLRKLSLSAGICFYTALIYTLTAGAWAIHEAGNIRVERLVIASEKIPVLSKPLKIVQISDVHVGLIVRRSRVGKILAIVREEAPDLLLSTGDLVDGQMDHLDGLTGLFQDIKPPYGKYAVTGNHEYYAGLRQSLAFTERAGFKTLRGSSVTIKGLLNLAGVDDQTGRYFNEKHAGAAVVLSGLADHSLFTVLMKHRPVIDAHTAGLFDLQVSGHTHGGQIFPFSIITRLYFPHHTGHERLPDGRHLYVSRGTGTWGPPMRFLSPPEVTVIELVHSEPPDRG